MRLSTSLRAELPRTFFCTIWWRGGCVGPWVSGVKRERGTRAVKRECQALAGKRHALRNAAAGVQLQPGPWPFGGRSGESKG